MDVQQLVFSEVLVEADERNRAAQDELRMDVQAFFDQLPPRQKDSLGLWLSGTAAYDAHVALAAAAGDWHHTRQKELIKCLLSTPDRFCIGEPEQKSIRTVSKKAPDIGGLLAFAAQS